MGIQHMNELPSVHTGTGIFKPVYDIDFILGRNRPVEVEGLVLSGGGAKGAYEAGVLNRLAERGLIKRPTVISGASIGAINAAYIAEQLLNGASFYSATKDLVTLWETIKQSDVLDVNLWGLIKGAMLNTESLLSTKKIKAFITKYIPEARTIGDYMSGGIELVIPGTNLNKARTDIFGAQHTVIDAVLASAAFPVGYPSRKINRQWYTDGGVLENTPMKPVIRAGATKLWVLYLTNEKFLEDTSDYLRARDVLMRMVDMTHELLIFQDVKTAKKYNELIRLIFQVKDKELQKQMLAVLKFDKKDDGFQKRVVDIVELMPTEPLGATFNFFHDHLVDLIARGRADADRFAAAHNAEQNVLADG